MALVRIYAVCGGTNAANGFYTNDGTDQYINEKNSSYKIHYADGYWYISYIDSPLYRLAAASSSVDPTSDTAWTIMNGSSPTVKTFNGDSYSSGVTDSNNNYVFGTVVISGASISAANGNYLFNNSSEWTHTNGLYEIAVFSCSDLAIYRISDNTPLYRCTSNLVGFHPVTIYDNSSSWETVVGNGGGTAPTSSSYDSTTICSTGGSENAGNNYTHSRLVDTITITGAAGSYTGANGTYYASRNWASGTSEANGDLPIFVHANGNYIIYYNTIGEWWQISESLISGALYVNGEYLSSIPVGSWTNEDAPSGNVTSTTSTTRRFFVRKSGNNFYLRHTS